MNENCEEQRLKWPIAGSGANAQNQTLRQLRHLATRYAQLK